MTVAYKSPATSANLNNSFISRTDNQNASGEINFVNGIEINGTPISNADGNIKIESVKSLILPSGNTADAGASATWVNGMIRYDRELAKLRGYEDGEWKNVIATATGGNGSLIGSPQVFTASGTYDKTVNNPSYIIVWVQAGGGGGGGVTNAGANESGGGGGGEFALKRINFADLGSTETVTVGAGGAGGASGNNAGSTGGTSSFGAHVTCIGGTGGSGSNASASTNGGAGGTGGSGGDFHLAGGYGGGGRLISSASVGAAFGGASFLSNPQPLETVTPPLRRNGVLYGGGGSGNRTASAASAGSDGANGVVIVWEYS